jgi:hypothetical protein
VLPPCFSRLARGSQRLCSWPSSPSLLRRAPRLWSATLPATTHAFAARSHDSRHGGVRHLRRNHDVPRPGRGNVDHFVAGWSSAFVIETKSGKRRGADRGQAISNAIWAKAELRSTLRNCSSLRDERCPNRALTCAAWERLVVDRGAEPTSTIDRAVRGGGEWLASENVAHALA